MKKSCLAQYYGYFWPEQIFTWANIYQWVVKSVPEGSFCVAPQFSHCALPFFAVHQALALATAWWINALCASSVTCLGLSALVPACLSSTPPSLLCTTLKKKNPKPLSTAYVLDLKPVWTWRCDYLGNLLSPPIFSGVVADEMVLYQPPEKPRCSPQAAIFAH